MITKEKMKKIIASLLAIRMLATDQQALDALNIYPTWSGDNIKYQINDRVLYEQKLYKCLQAHQSQPQWTPIAAASLWTKVLIPSPDIPEWEQPSSTNPYMTGDKVKYNNKIWISIVDNNVWQPGVYGWEEVEGGS